MIMYYRRKVLLALLQRAGEPVQKTRLHKYLFLLSRDQEKPSFDFVPHKFGCFSFQVASDLGTLNKYGELEEGEDRIVLKNTREDYFGSLRDKDRLEVDSIITQFKDKTIDELLTFTYRKYPFFAIRSTRTQDLLNAEEIGAVENSRPQGVETRLFTIGYEGLSLDAYLVKLIENSIKVLCDVRKNPLSMKYGFSKKQLSSACEKVGVEYRHFPEVGIESNKRQKLETREDYDRLFNDYRNTTLEQTGESQEAISGLLKSNRRLALACFEKDPSYCHRSHLAEAVSKTPGFEAEIEHI